MKQENRPQAALGRAIRKLRTAAGISQEELAELAELHRTYIGDVERGERNISLVNMIRVAEALGVNLGRLVREMEKDLRR